MKALIRKDLNGLSFFCVVGTILTLFQLVDRGFINIWILHDMPKETLQTCYVIWGGLGLVFGCFAAIRDELMGTEEYLLHRPMSREKIFNARTSACLVVVATWISVPFLFHMLFPGLWNPNAAIADWGRFWSYAGCGMVAFSGFAVGYFAASLRLFWGTRLKTGIVSILGLLALSWHLPRAVAGEFGSSLSTYVIVHLIVTVLLLWGARCNFLSHHDLDRPISERTLRVSATVTALLLIAIGDATISNLQRGIHSSQIRHWPLIVTHDGPKPYLMKHDREFGIYVEVDEDMNVNPVGRRIKNVRDDLDLGVIWSEYLVRPEICFKQIDYYYLRYYNLFQNWNPGREVRLFAPFTMRMERYNWRNQYSFNIKDGWVYHCVLSTNEYPVTPSMTRIGKGPDMMPFSSASVPVSYQVFARQRGFTSNTMIMMHDPEDGGLWMLDQAKEEPFFRRVNLPGNDRYVKTVGLQHARDQLFDTEKIEAEDKEFIPYIAEVESAIKGEKGIYIWDGEIFRTIPDTLVHAMHLGWQTSGIPTYDLVKADLLSPKVELRDEEGMVRYSYTYGLRTSGDKLRGALLFGVSFLKAPAAILFSFCVTVPPNSIDLGSHLFIDPLVVSQSRLWFVITHIALAGILAWLTMKGLKRRGASRSRRLYWGGLILVGGMCAWLVCQMLERDRAYRTIKIMEEEQKDTLLIASAQENL